MADNTESSCHAFTRAVNARMLDATSVVGKGMDRALFHSIVQVVGYASRSLLSTLRLGDILLLLFVVTPVSLGAWLRRSGGVRPHSVDLSR
jgi:hypothetical protein